LQPDNESNLHAPQMHLTTPAPYPSKDTVSARIGQEMVGWWSFKA
jgi:hypothetical protein